MDVVNKLIGDSSPYVELINPSIYIQRFTDALKEIGDEISSRLTTEDVQSMWEEKLRVTKTSIMQTESDEEEDSGPSDEDLNASEQTLKSPSKRQKGMS
jgi:hypothetical protein